MLPPSTAAPINIGGETSVKVSFSKYSRAYCKVLARIFMTMLILRLRSQRWRMSRIHSSLLSLVMGKTSAKPMIMMDSAEISNPPGARVSGFVTPVKLNEDSIVSFSACSHAVLDFLTVHWITPVESLTKRKINSFPLRLR